MPLEEAIVTKAIDSLAGETTDFLCYMIRIPSTRGNEGSVNRLVAERMKGLCTDAELMPIPTQLTLGTNCRYTAIGFKIIYTSQCWIKFFDVT